MSLCVQYPPPPSTHETCQIVDYATGSTVPSKDWVSFVVGAVDRYSSPSVAAAQIV